MFDKMKISGASKTGKGFETGGSVSGKRTLCFLRDSRKETRSIAEERSR